MTVNVICIHFAKAGDVQASQVALNRYLVVSRSVKQAFSVPFDVQLRWQCPLFSLSRALSFLGQRENCLQVFNENDVKKKTTTTATGTAI